MRIATMHLVMSEVRQGGYIRISNAHPDEPGTYIQGVSTPTGGKACKREPAPQLGQREDKGTTRQVNIFRSCYRLTQPLDRGSNNRPITSIYKYIQWGDGRVHCLKLVLFFVGVLLVIKLN